MLTAGVAQAAVLEGTFEPSPHMFVEKQVVAVNITNAYLDGTKEAIPYTHCEVYAPTELMSNVRCKYGTNGSIA